MALVDISFALKATAALSRASDHWLGALDRRRPNGFVGSVLLSLGLEVGLEAQSVGGRAHRHVHLWVTGSVLLESTAIPSSPPFDSCVERQVQNDPVGSRTTLPSGAPANEEWLGSFAVPTAY